MSSGKLLPSIFQSVHPKFRTPTISLFVFCAVALLEVVFAALPSLDPSMAAFYAQRFNNESGIDFLGDLYAFGAATSYSFVFVALVALRLVDPLSPRKFKIPFNIPFTFRGERVEFPVIAVVGFIGIVAILVFTMITHPIGRIAGPLWIVFGIGLYFIYRSRRELPLFRSRKRDWPTEQVGILRRAGELELMDEYLANVKASEARRETVEA
jgi:APA family basic amino acid/polyamine antiporter